MSLVSGMAYMNLTRIGNETIDISSENLKNQIITNIQKSSNENAEIIEAKFRNAEAAVAKIVKATEELFDPSSNLGSIKSYHDSETNSSLPDHGYDNTYQEIISNTTSTYYYPGNRLTADMNQTIQRSAYLDLVFRPIHEQNREYVWLYVAFSNGVFRNFPGAFVDLKREYNPPLEDWYIEAVQARGAVVYSPPYFDITQGLVVSLTQAVYVEGNLIGVVGLDFKITTIRDKVLKVNILDQGYASLFQKEDFTLLAHPEWDAENHDINQELPTINDFETNIDGSPALSIENLQELKNKTNGTIEFEKNGEGFILTFSQISTAQGPLYDFAVVVKVAEVLASVARIQNDMNQKQSSLQRNLFLFFIFITLAILGVGLYLSNAVTKPIGKLTQAAKQITLNATKEDLFENVVLDETIVQDDEIGDLTRSFAEMVEHLRAENKKKGKK